MVGRVRFIREPEISVEYSLQYLRQYFQIRPEA